MKKIATVLLLVVSIQFAQAQNNTPIQKDIRRFLELSGSAEMGILVMKQMISSFEKAYPSVPAEFWDEFIKEVDPDELIDLMVPLYEKYYTHDDINALISFYKSPIGKKMVKVTPNLTKDSMVAGRAWGEKIGKKVAAKMQKEGYMK